MKQTNYEAPRVEVMELILEEGILTSSGVGGHERSTWTDYEL